MGVILYGFKTYKIYFLNSGNIFSSKSTNYIGTKICVKIELLLSVLQYINEEVSCLVICTNISNCFYIIEIIHLL